MKRQMRKILVTGGAGFLGSHLCEKLLQMGHEVLCIDNLYTGSLENIALLKENKGFQFLQHDVCEPFSVKIDAIYNLACPASPLHYQSDPIKTFQTSVLGAMHLLELSRKNRCPIFQASTSEVYGDPHVHPQKEDYWGNVNSIGIRACYDEGKRGAETLFFDYARHHQTNIRVARIFNTYGPRMHPNDGRVVSNFIVQALQNLPLTIYGNGSQTRSFCFVDDLIDGIIKLMHSPFVGPVNLGNPMEFQVIDLAKQVIALTGSRSQIVYRPLPLDDPKQRKPDIGLAKKELGWEPKVDLKEGLMRTIEYFERKLMCKAALH